MLSQDKGNLLGQMEDFMKDIFLMINNMDLEL
jgi:hypothetical protein